MIKYWPNEQSTDLNLAVANLFIQTYHKLSYKLSNKTKIYLPIDILNKKTKNQLFLYTLVEFEILIVDLIELNLSIEQIKKCNEQILYDLINKIMKQFIKKLCIKNKIYRVNFYYNYNKLFFHEHSIIIQQLLIYCIFGSYNIDNYLFPFYKLKTPFYHVKTLFENLIIQISNVITFNFLNNYASTTKIYNFLIKKYLQNTKYTSIREISNFRNNIISYNLIKLYIYYPQHIYCGQYQIWLLSSQGIIYKYIYINRYSDYIKLSNLQLSSIIYLELQDFIIPKMNNFIVILGKLIIYILIEIIIKGLSICFKKVIKKLNSNKN